MIRAKQIMAAKSSASKIGKILGKSRTTGWRILNREVNLTQREINLLVAAISGLKHKDFFG